ncbi:phytanoyl-CoA dioxygenase domain-containing protein 1 homolog [Branchiostoma lanceolatum]|uniref:phytanoyl-CoA dioxygenase domain-containing protein 1 homolog n=1 Tax=Branchiostoma lanceolatum TaxID=7740 RepID=UPI003451499D
MEACPEVYTTPPVQPKEIKPGQLTREQVKQFFDEGFVLVHDFFTPEELQPSRDATEALVGALAERLYQAGKIKHTYRDADLFKRLTLIEEEFPGTCALLLKEGKIQKAYCDLWVNDRLLNVMEQLVGPEIAGNPLWNLRPKVPSNDETTVPWHQDNCYTLPESLGTLIPVAWIPLLDATVENGCMQVVRGGHRRGVTADHVGVVGGTWYVEVLEEEMERTLGVDMKTDVVTCEVPYGGVLFINNAIPHRSLPNKTEQIRWSLDLRWQDPAKPSGFWGNRKPILMRSANDPKYQVPQSDWDKFYSADRGSELERSTGLSGEEVDEFDTTVHGPWLTRWPIVRHNRHTRALLVQQGDN